MTNYILSINEQSKRGKLVKQLLNELRARREVQVMSLRDFERAEEKIIADEIRKGMKSPALSLSEAKRELLKLKKRNGR